MNTNAVPVTGLDSVPGLNLLPTGWQGPVLIAAFFVQFLPYIGRAWHAWKNGGGFVGARNAVLFGTNTPAATPPPATKAS